MDPTIETAMRQPGLSLATYLSISVLLTGLLVSLFRLLHKNEPQPPYLKETIPFISNTYQYLTDMGAFLDRVTYIKRIAVSLSP